MSAYLNVVVYAEDLREVRSWGSRRDSRSLDGILRSELLRAEHVHVTAAQ